MNDYTGPRIGPSREETPLPTDGAPVTIAWSGSPWSLAGLGLINFLLSIVTLGIYSFWGRTEVRRRIWSSIRLNDEPLEYTGKGSELFAGFLIVFFVVLLPLTLLLGFAPILFTWLFGPEVGGPIGGVVFVATLVLLYMLIGVAIYRAYRYRLSRTRWRGIRGALVGSSWRYGWHYFWTLLLLPFTMGWLMPWRANLLQRRLTNDMRFGEEKFSYTGKAGPLYSAFALAWVGGVLAFLIYAGGIFAVMWPRLQEGIGEGGDPTISTPLTMTENGMIIGSFVLAAFVGSFLSVWYYARLTNYMLANTHYDKAKFAVSTTGLGFLWQFVSNYFIVLLSLSILTPVAQARMTKYLVDRMNVDGTVDFDRVAQSTAAADKRGEGLATAFDVDAF